MIDGVLDTVSDDDPVRQWLVECLHRVPAIVETMRADGYSSETVSRYLMEGAIVTWPQQYQRVWNMTMHAWTDPEFFAEQRPDAQRFFLGVFADAKLEASLTLQDGVHRQFGR